MKTLGLIIWLLSQCCVIGINLHHQREIMAHREPCYSLAETWQVAIVSLTNPLSVFVRDAEGFQAYCRQRGER